MRLYSPVLLCFALAACAGQGSESPAAGSEGSGEEVSEASFDESDGYDPKGPILDQNAPVAEAGEGESLVPSAD